MRKGRCRHCHKAYEYYGTQPDYCAECYLKDEADYNHIRKMVEEHPGVRLIDLAHKTGISHSRILHFMEIDRPDVIHFLSHFLRCEACQKIINLGTYCDECGKKET